MRGTVMERNEASIDVIDVLVNIEHYEQFLVKLYE